jgi:acyl-CoA dehydrogenase
MAALGEGLSLEPVAWSAILSTQLYVDCDAFALRDGRLTALASGAAKAAAGLGDLRWLAPTPGKADVTATLADGSWCLRGEKRFVMGGDVANHFLLAASLGDGDVGLFEIPAGTPGLTLRNYRCHDGRRAVDLRLHEVRLPQLAMMARSDQARASLANAMGLATLGLCADSIGAMRGALRLSIDYLQTRRQFDQALAQFQALRHRVVDHYRNWFFAEAMVRRAAQGWSGTATPEWLADLSAAKWACGLHGRQLGLDAIQLHGAIGMQDETPISHYAQRLVANDTLLGHHEQHLGNLIRASRASMAGASQGESR